MWGGGAPDWCSGESVCHTTVSELGVGVSVPFRNEAALLLNMTAAKLPSETK